VPSARSRALGALLLRLTPSGRSHPPAPHSPWFGSAPFLRSACTSSSRPIAAASRRLCSQRIDTRHQSQQSQHPSLSRTLSRSLSLSLALSRPARPHHRASTRPRPRICSTPLQLPWSGPSATRPAPEPAPAAPLGTTWSPAKWDPPKFVVHPRHTHVGVHQPLLQRCRLPLRGRHGVPAAGFAAVAGVALQVGLLDDQERQNLFVARHLRVLRAMFVGEPSSITSHSKCTRALTFRVYSWRVICVYYVMCVCVSSIFTLYRHYCTDLRICAGGRLCPHLHDALAPRVPEG
jgi:hypothetical protein